MKSYIYQVFNLDTEKDKDLIIFITMLKRKRLAATFIRSALREKIAREKESDE